MSYCNLIDMLYNILPRFFHLRFLCGISKNVILQRSSLRGFPISAGQTRGTSVMGSGT